jgi:site-specific DNA recombinase
VEDTVAREVAAQVFTDGFVESVVDGANQCLAAGPMPAGQVVGNSGVEPEVRRRKAAIRRLTGNLANVNGADDEQAMFRQIAVLRQEIKELQDRAPKQSRSRSDKVPPLTVESVRALLADLREILRADVAVAAPILAALTGPVVVTQEKVDGASESEWVARFSINMAPVMAVLGRKKGCPTTGTWEYLSTRSWTTGKSVAARVRATPRYEEIAAEAGSMASAGASIEAIAHAMKTDWQTAKNAVDHAKAVGPSSTTAFRLNRRSEPKLDQRRTAEVVRLRDEEAWSFRRIAEHLGISAGTVTRVYDRHQHENVQRSAGMGKTPARGRYRHLDRELVAKVESMLKAGRPAQEIAKAVNCGVSTVYRERRRLRLARSG